MLRIDCTRLLALCGGGGSDKPVRSPVSTRRRSYASPLRVCCAESLELVQPFPVLLPGGGPGQSQILLAARRKSIQIELRLY